MIAWQAAALLLLGGSTVLLFAGIPVAFSFLGINLIGAWLFLGGDAGMAVQDLVKITTYLVRPEDVAAAGAARAKHFGDARPGSATIIVKALVNPSWFIAIEAVAAARAARAAMTPIPQVQAR